MSAFGEVYGFYDEQESGDSIDSADLFFEDLMGDSVALRKREERYDKAFETPPSSTTPITIPADFRMGVWLDIGGRSLAAHGAEHAALLHDLGFSDACIMINEVNSRSFGFSVALVRAIGRGSTSQGLTRVGGAPATRYGLEFFRRSVSSPGAAAAGKPEAVPIAEQILSPDANILERKTHGSARGMTELGRSANGALYVPAEESGATGKGLRRASSVVEALQSLRHQMDMLDDIVRSCLRLRPDKSWTGGSDVLSLR